jgi:hypothetical protein
MVRLTGPLVVPVGLLESVALTVRFAVPGAVGVPLTTQPAPRARPAGRVPAVIVQEYGDVPPLTPIVASYGMPVVPFGSEVTVSISGVADVPTVMLKEPVALAPTESCACAVKGDVPCVVGTPEMTPVEGDRVSPVGSEPDTMLHV